MRPSTSAHFTRSGTASIRSGTASMRTGTTSSGARPFTSSRSVRPGNQAANLPSAGEVKDFKRPVTAAGGLGNVNTKSNSKASFQNRQIQDATYYLGLLNSKEREITAEIHKIKQDIESLSQSNDSQRKIENVHEELVQEVRELEGLLADHNVAKEKVRQGFDVEDIQAQFLELKMRNEQEANDLDEIFVLKRKCDEEVKTVSNDIESMHQLIKKRLQETDPKLFEQYQKYQTGIKEMEERGKTMEEEIRVLQKDYARLQSIVHESDEFQIRKLYMSEKEKINDMKKKLLDIDEDLHIAEMDYQEAHSYLLEKAKKAQSRTKLLIQEENELKNEIKQVEEQLQKFNVINDKSNDFRNQLTRSENEKTIDEEISKSNDMLQKIMYGLETKQTEISGLLEKISRFVTIRKNSKPTERSFKELNKDRDFKVKHLANSQKTVSRLIDQKDKRMKELEMVENLESKITSEKKDLIEKMDVMRKEHHLYSDLDRLEESDELTRLYLTQMRERYIQRCDFMRSKVKEISSEYEKNQSILNKSATWKSLQDQEEKLRRQGQVVFSLQESVKDKERKTNYESSKSRCLALANKLIIEQ